MKIILILMLVWLVPHYLKAQSGNKYFINGQETIPQSLNFLDPGDIDSIKLVTGDKTKAPLSDTVVLVTMKAGAITIRYDSLLEYFSINNAARKLPLRTTVHYYTNGIPNADLMLFSLNMVTEIDVNRNNKTNQLSVFIRQRYLYWNRSSSIENLLYSLTKKFNYADLDSMSKTIRKP
jgi:hypothetical protein